MQERPQSIVRWARPGVLFIAEAPPNSIERYFYFEDVERDDWLWVGLMSCLYPKLWSTTNLERRQKRNWLTRFQRDGCQLIDAVKRPIIGKSRQRVAAIAQDANELIQEIGAIKPRGIVLIKATVYKALYQRLTDFPVLNRGPIPFPSNGWQIKFCDELSKLNLMKDLK